jgi:hypothetical protein
MLAFAMGVLVACGDDSGEAPVVEAEGGIDGVVLERVGPYEHFNGPAEYDRLPPSGGDHPPAPGWQNCGFYDAPITQEYAVHSLEHGAVWITYAEDTDEASLEAVRELVDRKPGRVIASPYPGLDSPFQLLSWGRRLVLDDITDERAAAFVDAYTDSDAAPEAGAACQQGTGPGQPVG